MSAVGIMSIDTIASSARHNRGISAPVESELYRLRDLESIKDFAAPGSHTYSGDSFRVVMKFHSEIFPEMPRWSIAQMIEYALGGYRSDIKEGFIGFVELMPDDETQEYLRKKRNGLTIGAETQDTLLRPINDAGELDVGKLTHDLYVVPERIAELTGLGIDQVRKFTYVKGIESVPCGPGNRHALNIATLLPLMQKSEIMGRETVILWNYYADLINLLTHS